MYGGTADLYSIPSLFAVSYPLLSSIGLQLLSTGIVSLPEDRGTPSRIASNGSIGLPANWSGGGYAHANTKNGIAKVGRKGDPLLASMVVAVAVADLV